MTDPDEKYGYVQRLTPSLDKMYNFSEEEVRWFVWLVHIICVNKSVVLMCICMLSGRLR